MNHGIMSLIESIVLGIVQGLTEFLPVSSSGHLEIGKALFGDTMLPEQSLLFTVMLHFATALSTLVVYRKDVGEIFKGLFQFKWNEDTQFTLKIIISMIPAALVGIVFNDEIEYLFSGQIMLVGFMLIITALLLYLADKAKNTQKKVSFLNSFVVGISQAIAIMPGISRSGATISTSVLLRIDRSRAARFSFLMVVPLILGKVAMDLMEGHVTLSGNQFEILLAGFVAAFISGLIACRWMINLVRKGKLIYFSIYCFIVGSIAIILSL